MLSIAFLSQKGGVGKSTLSRLIAREYAAAGWRVKIADMDIAQATSTNWNRRRMAADVKPEISVEPCNNIQKALATTDQDLIIFDGAPAASRQTLDIAKRADLIIIPTGIALDDMEPSVRLAHELKANGVEKAKICFAFNGVGTSTAEIEDAEKYIHQTSYTLLSGYIPEKTAYRRASDQGFALSETTFPSLNQAAEKLAQSIVNQISTFVQ